MNKDVEKLELLRKQLMDYHEDFYTFLTETLSVLQKNKYTPGELCDIGFLCRKLEVWFEELRKTAKARKELCIKMMGFIIATQKVMSPEDYEDKIEGELASARVAASSIPKIPTEDDPQYEAFMISLGLPREFLKGGLLKPDFKEVSKLVTNLVQEGKSLPPGVEAKWTQYTANFYEKKNGSKEM